MPRAAKRLLIALWLALGILILSALGEIVRNDPTLEGDIPYLLAALLLGTLVIVGADRAVHRWRERG